MYIINVLEAETLRERQRQKFLTGHISDGKYGEIGKGYGVIWRIKRNI